jgi:hypothetical protein
MVKSAGSKNECARHPLTEAESTRAAAQWAEIPKTWSRRLFAGYSRCEYLVFDEILYIEVFKVAGYESAIYFVKKQNGETEMATIFFFK